VPAIDGAREASELIALCERAEADGGWLVLLFHGVGGDHLAVSAEAHAALVEHLARRRDALWTENFRTVARHIRATREKTTVTAENLPGRTP
jgi:predicted esterase